MKAIIISLTTLFGSCCYKANDLRYNIWLIDSIDKNVIYASSREYFLTGMSKDTFIVGKRYYLLENSKGELIKRKSEIR